jgi:hypothetical protein
MQPHSEPNRWAVLALLGVAQLMVVLDSPRRQGTRDA